MTYYQCSVEELNAELRRRGYTSSSDRDQLSEILKRDDEIRGTDATTVTTAVLGPYVPRELNLSRTAEFGDSNCATRLVNQRIVYWTMNTFFPTLQLFFASGYSCTIDGSHLPDASVGLDTSLRFRLTDCTHEEDGRIIKSLTPDKFAPDRGIRIIKAAIGERTSVMVRLIKHDSYTPSPRPLEAFLDRQAHIVVGLRLEGMSQMAYVWAKSAHSSVGGSILWGDVRLAGFRNDVPSPHVGFPLNLIKAGGEVTVFSKTSRIRDDLKSDGDTAQVPREPDDVDGRDRRYT